LPKGKKNTAKSVHRIVNYSWSHAVGIDQRMGTSLDLGVGVRVRARVRVGGVEPCSKTVSLG
jgi:hypothetical protein